jgi:hypothetical protein
MNMGASAPPKPPNAGSVMINGTGTNPFASIIKSLKSNLPSSESLNEIICFVDCACMKTQPKNAMAKNKKHFIDEGFICLGISTLQFTSFVFGAAPTGIVIDNIHEVLACVPW